ncbi:MAG: glycosyltransferase [candidate division WOR-3 bacterium]
MNKNIVYIGHFDLKQKNAAYFRVRNNGKIFNSLGNVVIYIGIMKENPKQIKFNNDENFILYPKNFLNWLKYFFNTKKIFDKTNYIKNADIIILYDPIFFIFIYFYFYCKRNKIKLILDLTEWYGFQGKNILFKIIKGIDSNLVLRLMCKKVDGLILVSKNFYKYFKRYKNKAYIPPLVDIEEKKWENNSQASKNDKDEIVKFIYFGEPGRGRKDDLNFLVKTFSKLNNKNFVLNIVGITKEDFLILNKKNGNNFIETKNIKFHGRLTHEKTLELLKNSDFSIFIRKSNVTNTFGFPTKFVESFSMGIPVITNITSNIGDYLIDGFNGFIVNYSSLEIKLNYILNLKKDDIIKLKNNVRRDLFWYKNYINKMKRVIENL